MNRSNASMAPIVIAALVAGCAAGTDESDTTTDETFDMQVDTVTDMVPDGDVGGTELGGACTGNWNCQDGLYCNGTEVCEAGICQRGISPDCSDIHDCTVDECDDDSESCTHTPDDTLCADSLACNGEERCSPTLGCQPADTPPCDDSIRCTLDTCEEPDGICTNEISDLACDDAVPCTVDTCDTDADECSNVLIDDDGDGFAPLSCGGNDCDDDDSDVHPGAEELCDDELDTNCNALADANDPACCGDAADTCECPGDMTVGGNFVGVTGGKTNDTCGECSTTPCAMPALGAPDVVYYMHVTAASLLRWSFTSTTWNTYVYLRAGNCHGPELMCEDPSYSDVAAIVEAGTYYFFIDGDDLTSFGPYDVDAAVTPLLSVTGNDTCGFASAAALDRSYTGSLTGMNDDADPPPDCVSGSGRDAVFRYELETAGLLEISTEGSEFDTVLYILDDTCSHTGLPCDDDGGTGNTSKITGFLPAGTLYIVVDELTAGSTGDYVLTVAMP